MPHEPVPALRPLPPPPTHTHRPALSFVGWRAMSPTPGCDWWLRAPLLGPRCACATRGPCWRPPRTTRRPWTTPHPEPPWSTFIPRPGTACTTVGANWGWAPCRTATACVGQMGGPRYGVAAVGCVCVIHGAIVCCVCVVHGTVVGAWSMVQLYVVCAWSMVPLWGAWSMVQLWGAWSMVQLCVVGAWSMVPLWGVWSMVQLCVVCVVHGRIVCCVCVVHGTIVGCVVHGTVVCARSMVQLWGTFVRAPHVACVSGGGTHDTAPPNLTLIEATSSPPPPNHRPSHTRHVTTL